MNFFEIFCFDRAKALRILSDPKACIDVNYRTDNGWTCVHRASDDGDVYALQKLIERNADLWQKDDKFFYPMHYAVCSSHYDILQLILFYKIPDDVLGDITKDFTDFFVRGALICKDLRIPKLLVNKFFKHISIPYIRMIVHHAIKQNNAYDLLTKVFDGNEKVILLLREGRWLCIHLESKQPSSCVVEYLLNSVDSSYFPMKVNAQFISQDTEDVLEALLRHSDKVTELISPDALFYAVKTQSLYAVDLLLALGCNPYAIPRAFNNSCFFEAITDCFDNQYNPLHLVILHKILMYSGYRKPEKPVIVRNVSHDFAFRMYELSDFSVRTISNFYHEVTLFDILYYQHYLGELREKFTAS